MREASATAAAERFRVRHPPTARIGVIDPYAVSRRGLEAALADSPLAGEVEVVLEPDAAAACRTILIEPHGLPFLRQHALNTRIRSDRPRLVLWSWDGDRYDVRHRFDGRLDKHHPTAALPAYFCDAVRQAEAGRRLPHGSHFFADWSSGVGSQAFHLTGREVDVLRLLGEGGTNAQIADDYESGIPQD